jgi:hypothetical protein
MWLENPHEKQPDWQTQMVCHVNPNNNPQNDYYGHNGWVAIKAAQSPLRSKLN